MKVTNPGAQTTTVGVAVRFQIHASDTDGGTLAYSARGLPKGLSIAPATGLITGSPKTAGRSTVIVSAADQTGPTGTTSFKWTVIAPPAPTGPVRSSPPGHGTLRSPRLTTHAPNTVLIATIASDTRTRGPAQRVTSLTGGGLRWRPVIARGARGGFVAIYYARAPRALTGPHVRVTLANPNVSATLTVTPFSPGTTIAGSAATTARAGPARIRLTEPVGAIIWTVGHDQHDNTHATAGHTPRRSPAPRSRRDSLA